MLGVGLYHEDNKLLIAVLAVAAASEQAVFDKLFLPNKNQH